MFVFQLGCIGEDEHFIVRSWVAAVVIDASFVVWYVGLLGYLWVCSSVVGLAFFDDLSSVLLEQGV